MQDTWASRNMSRNDSSSTLVRLCWLIFLFSSQLWAVLRIWDVYPGSQILFFTHLRSRISEPKTATKEKVKKLWCHIFFVATNFTKLKIILFEMLKKKIWANFGRIIELFTQKLSLSSQKYSMSLVSGIQDPGSGKNIFRNQGSKRHRIPDSGSATLVVRESVDSPC